VVRLAPHHYNARLQLSVIMRSLGRPEDALLALTQDETEEMLNPRLMFERCQLLLAENKIQEFVDKAKMLFSRHFVNIRSVYGMYRCVSTNESDRGVFQSGS
jgi:hypothetical protein